MAGQQLLMIPKDPRSPYLIFLTAFPIQLEHIILKEEWEEIVNGLNKIILSWEDPSIFWIIIGIIRTILIIPTLLEFSSFETKVKSYLEKVNSKLKHRGICILNPIENGYINLEVVINQNTE